MTPKIEIDANSGFCFGVTTAISKAEEELRNAGTLYCLGDIVHNSDEVERLRSKGLVTITHADLRNLHDANVLLRAHGEPPETYRIARENNIRIIDATCPVVLQLQRRIKQAYDTRSDKETLILIYGKPGHAEVNGLVGQTNGEAHVITNVDDLMLLNQRIPLAERRVILYSQTTQPIEGLQQVVDALKGLCPETQFSYYDTICRQVANRIPRLREFARAHDVILFVSGKKSSNGRALYEECRAVNPRTYMISNPSEIRMEWCAGAESIGICGATSTPTWLMAAVKSHLSTPSQPQS